MCLIIKKPADVTFTKEWLADFWRRNDDGVGVMYAEAGKVVVHKLTSPTLAQWLAFYDRHARARECVIHLRMRTHGDINNANTHPYFIGRGYWLMHNGVLASGNAADRSKSDTWHFINDVIKPALRENPNCLEEKEFLDSIARQIGGTNRFAIIGPNGIVKILNRRSGIEWGGAWLSNTYAWSAPLLGDYMIAPSKAKVVRSANSIIRDRVKKTVKKKSDAFIHKATYATIKPSPVRMGPSTPPVRIVTPRYLRPELWMPKAPVVPIDDVDAALMEMERQEALDEAAAHERRMRNLYGE